MGEIIAHQFLDAVFHHIADDQGKKQWPGDVTEFHLAEPGYGRGENHCDAGGQAVVKLFHCHPVLFLVEAYEQVAFHKFLEHSVVVNEFSVCLGVISDSSEALFATVLRLVPEEFHKPVFCFLKFGAQF